jgi:hypothetical protein
MTEIREPGPGRGVIGKFLPIRIRHDPAGGGLVRVTLGPA